MDRNRLSLFFNTIKYLRPVQIFYLIFYKIKSFLPKKKYDTNYVSANHNLKWPVLIKKDIILKDNSFEFLNLKYSFKDNPDWNFIEHGTLWNYNLNYLDFLNQKKFNKKLFIKILKNFISNKKESIFGRDPYPISLRNINILKFILSNKIKDHLIDKSMYEDYILLYNNFEFHLQGNHLLENSISLLLGGIYFDDKKFLKYSEKILSTELDKQILSDGAHYELSPMYHMILLERILETIIFLKSNNLKDLYVYDILVEKSKKMISWISNIIYKDFSFPLVNDSAKNIGINFNEISFYEKKINLGKIKNLNLSDSGFRRVDIGDFEIYINFSDVKAKNQPGHKHADFLNFELKHKGNSIIIDPGVSTYNLCEDRLIQRSSSFHNTIVVNEKSSCEVWHSFKLGRRPKLQIKKQNKNFLEASYKSYDNKYEHTRKFIIEKKSINVEDTITGNDIFKIESNLHFDSDDLDIIDKQINFGDLRIKFNNYESLCLKKYNCPDGFNKFKQNKKLIGLVQKKSGFTIFK